MVTECAFGQLKGCWRVLYQKCEPSQESLKINILACIALHNICIEKEDLITQNLDFTLFTPHITNDNVSPFSHNQKLKDV